jgi:uncharacterized protein (DUF1330 family)
MMSNPVYLMAQIDVIDHEKYIEEYGMPVFDLLTHAGAEVLVATQDASVKEGQGFGNWTVLAKFQSEESANNFYTSKKYAPLKKLRVEKHSNGGNVMLFPGLG